MSPDVESRLGDEKAHHAPASTLQKQRKVSFWLPLSLVLIALLAVSQWHGRHSERVIAHHDNRPEAAAALREDTGLVANGIVDEREQALAMSLKRQSAPATPLLECFQVAQPVIKPSGTSLTVLLMDHIFANSYNQPFVGNYTPPDFKFNRVTLNFSAVEAGRQYDRLALMYLGDTEVWRTSTAEPTVTGIHYGWQKDVTHYLSLWKQPQTVIFDLGNIVNDMYTASINTTLTATFFWTDVETDQAPPSDLIIPISKRQGSVGGVSNFVVPQDNATNTVSFPQNAKRAVFSVSANGQSNEEFWWSNVLQSDTDTFDATAGSYFGYSPWREVQLFIDGQLAGVQWPFPVIFTGGVVPSIHRPIVGVDAFDLREHEIDITPFLPLLSDGKDHTFTINVAGLLDDGGSTGTITETVGTDWYVTGKIFIWLDDEGSITTGAAPTVVEPAPEISLSQKVSVSCKGTNKTLTYITEVKRTFTTSAKVVTQNSSEVVTWSQSLTYSNYGYVFAFGFDQLNDFLITGTDEVSGPTFYRTSYRYPLWANSSYYQSPDGNVTLSARVIQGLDLAVAGASVYPTGLEAFAAPAKAFAGSLLTTSKDGTGFYFSTNGGKNSSGFGNSTQIFHFGGTYSPGYIQPLPDVELYFRNVSAANNTILYDTEVVAGTMEKQQGFLPASPSQDGPGSDQYAQAPLSGPKGSSFFANRGKNNS